MMGLAGFPRVFVAALLPPPVVELSSSLYRELGPHQVSVVVRVRHLLFLPLSCSGFMLIDRAPRYTAQQSPLLASTIQACSLIDEVLPNFEKRCQIFLSLCRTSSGHPLRCQ